MQFSTLQPPQRLLFGPGPTMVEPRVYEALAKPLIGHLDPYFIGVLDQVREMLRSAFGTRNPLTWAMSGTGSSGMETAIANFVEPHSKFAVLGCGFFGGRMAEMGRRQGARVAMLEKPWGEIFGYEEVVAIEIFAHQPQIESPLGDRGGARVQSLHRSRRGRKRRQSRRTA